MSCTAVHTVTAADMTALTMNNMAFVAGDSGVLDVTGTSNTVVVPGLVPPTIPLTGYGITEPLTLIGMLVATGLGLLFVSKRRRQFYLVLPPLR